MEGKMNLDYDVHNSPKEENYMNGKIGDFTDCIDFTKQYQKSCLFRDNDPETTYHSSASSTFDRNSICDDKKFNCDDQSEDDINAKQSEDDVNAKQSEDDINAKLESPHKAERLPMEPHVSITVGPSNLEKTINHVAKGMDNGLGSVPTSKVIRKNFIRNRRNHVTNRKVSVLKLKNGKFMRKTKPTPKYHCIQSNIKFKCYKCSNSDFSSISELQAHQKKCIDHQSQESSFASPTSSSNVRVTRKVYLCSACGSYYENWNLFLHMKEIHKRHICLHCLGMFSQPDKLAQHLHAKHGVVEQTLASTEDFLNIFRGTCYLICCSCETMFSEQEEFYEHSCTPSSLSEDTGACPLCGLTGAHFPTCRKAFSDRCAEPSPFKSHPALGKKLSNKKKKSSKKPKEVFRIVNNEHAGDISVTVRKQNLETYDDTQEMNEISPLRSSNEDLQYNEKMLQLYRPNKQSEKITSSIQSIEESINRVVKSSTVNDEEEEEEEEEEEDTNLDRTEEDTSMNKIEVEDKEQEPEPEPVPGPETEPEPAPAPPVEVTSFNNAENTNHNTNYSNFSFNHDLSDNDSSDSEKLTIALEQEPKEPQYEPQPEPDLEPEPETQMEQISDKPEDGIATAGTEIPYIYLKENCEDVKGLIKEGVKESCWNCVYCAHAKRIAVNGKQLGLHILAEHRFVVGSEEASEEDKSTSSKDIVTRIKEHLPQLSECYFNTDTFDSEDKSFWKPNDRIYECFHCLFATYVHKELCSHNRKMHQKSVFLCIMCKSNFYNYSELLCHLCPGIYVPGQVINPDITYRCFLCDVNPLPSSFRLMVHLRRRHNSCDICFEVSSNQLTLSTHVWKHKLSHMCYRCGIAYRNKPDIRKHLFWKHGTESVLCKKCLQKKWPHVYHFCVPPASFICDECSFGFKSAVALKVHKRLHAGELPHSCTKCEEKFVSKKLLEKHIAKHDQPPEPEVPEEVPPPPEEPPAEETPKPEVNGTVEKKKSKKRKVLTDVFDLPPVNLSESDDSDEEESKPNVTPVLGPTTTAPSSPPPTADLDPQAAAESSPVSNGFAKDEVKEEPPPPIVDGVWNNFEKYLVSKSGSQPASRLPSPLRNVSLSRMKAIMLSDHDYFAPPPGQQDPGSSKSAESSRLDHDYCNNNSKSKSKTKQKKHRDASSSSDSSSDSDSSCSCGSNCSCTSGTSSSDSSNDSDSDSREKSKEEKKSPKEEPEDMQGDPEPSTEVDISVHDVAAEPTIKESDLDTDETETDEDFYDYNPAREANRVLAEKRTQLLANLNGLDAFVPSPSTPVEKPTTPKKKSKLKKKRSQLRASNSIAKPSRKKKSTPMVSLPSSVTMPFATEPNGDSNSIAASDGLILQPSIRLHDEETLQSSGESDTKRPKRKRVPLKFYGFSSDDENESVAAPRKREKSEHNTTTPAPLVAVPPPVATPVEPPPNIWNPQSRTSLSWRIEKSESVTPKVNPIKIRTSQTMRQNSPFSVSGGEVFQIKRPERSFQINGNGNGNVVGMGTGQRNEKLYCFCQCPYDEVSEMIACDAEDCVIEWFHFECVGIMVPPKGSWFCPDCRKKLAAENEFLAPLNEPNAN